MCIEISWEKGVKVIFLKKVNTRFKSVQYVIGALKDKQV